MIPLSKRVAEAMEYSGKSQSEIASFVRISPPSVNDWLSGKTKRLKAETALAAARLMGVSADWLATGKGSMLGGGATAAYEEALPNGLPMEDKVKIIIDGLRAMLRAAGLSPDCLGARSALKAMMMGTPQAVYPVETVRKAIMEVFAESKAHLAMLTPDEIAAETLAKIEGWIEDTNEIPGKTVSNLVNKSHK